MAPAARPPTNGPHPQPPQPPPCQPPPRQPQPPPCQPPPPHRYWASEAVVDAPTSSATSDAATSLVHAGRMIFSPFRLVGPRRRELRARLGHLFDRSSMSPRPTASPRGSLLDDVRRSYPEDRQKSGGTAS